MDAVTYPQEEVIRFVNDRMVPLRVAFDAQPIATDFNVTWTPTLITLDMEGQEHHRTVGFLAPEELIPSLLLGIGKSHFERGELDEALASLDKLINEYPESDSAPEAVYMRGVSRYKKTHEADPLKEAYEKLRADYPDSTWVKRAYAYRLL